MKFPTCHAVRLVSFFAVLIFAFSSPVSATLVTFDNLPGNGAAPPAGYGGLNWPQAWGVLDAVNEGNVFGPNGYTAGMVSPRNVAYVGEGATAAFTSTSPGAKFYFYSAYLTAAWNDGFTLRVTGSFSGTQLYDNLYTLNASAPMLINFNYFGVDRVEMVMTAPGVHHAGYAYSGNQFLMDNMSVAPEPATTLLMALGLCGLLLTRRKNKRTNLRC